MGERRRVIGVGIVLMTWCALACTPPVPPHVEHARAETSFHTGGEEDAFTLGLLTYDTAVGASARMALLLEHLSQRLSHPVTIRSAATVDDWVNDLEAGQYDFALVDALTFVRLASEVYMPLVQTRGGNSLSLYARPHPAERGLADLAGSRVMTASRTLPLLRAFLVDRGLDPDRDLEVLTSMTDASCLQSLLIGDIEACAALDRAAHLYSERMDVQFQLLDVLPTPPPLLYVVHRRVATSVAETFTDAFWDLSIDDRLSIPDELRIDGFDPFDSATLEQARALLRLAGEH